jgi:hypothetical protein
LFRWSGQKGKASLLLLKTHRVELTGFAVNQFIHPKITTHHDGFNRRKGELMTMTNVNSELPRNDLAIASELSPC